MPNDHPYKFICEDTSMSLDSSLKRWFNEGYHLVGTVSMIKVNDGMSPLRYYATMVKADAGS